MGSRTRGRESEEVNGRGAAEGGMEGEESG